jgi:putative phosphoesterase
MGPFFYFIPPFFKVSLRMQIGILSDTHNTLPAEVFDIFRNVDLILHAGDIGSEAILTDLESIAPVRAIFGNTDTFPLVSRLRRMEIFKIEGFRFCMIHAIRSAKAFAFELLKMQQEVDVVIYGHTHTPQKSVFNKITFINPGSAASPRHGLKGSLAVMRILDGELDVEFKNI